MFPRHVSAVVPIHIGESRLEQPVVPGVPKVIITRYLEQQQGFHHPADQPEPGLQQWMECKDAGYPSMPQFFVGENLTALATWPVEDLLSAHQGLQYPRHGYVCIKLTYHHRFVKEKHTANPRTQDLDK